MNVKMIENYKRWLVDPTKVNFETLKNTVEYFSEGGLKYYDLRKTLKGTRRDVIDAFENQIRKEAYEEGYAKGKLDESEHSASALAYYKKRDYHKEWGWP